MIRRSRGWTLPELLIALAIATSLTVLAQQQYLAQQLRSQRGLATRALLQLALREEDYRLRHGRYTSSFAALLQIDATLLYVGDGGVFSTDAKVSSRYELRFDTGSDVGNDNWRLQAMAIGRQVADAPCQNWTLDARGRKTASGSSVNALRDCWP